MSTPSTCERPSAERAAAGRRTRTATQAQALPSGPAASRQIIVSNRLPYRVDVDESGEVSMTRSAGGLATALGPLHERSGNLWIGSVSYTHLPPHTTSPCFALSMPG